MATTPTMTTAAPPPRKAAAALLCLCVSLHAARPVRASDRGRSGGDPHRHDDRGGSGDVRDFVPPGLSFAAADYFASLRDGGVVSSVQQNDENHVAVVGGGGEEVPWTVWQGVPTSVAATSNDEGNDENEGGDAAEEMARRRKEAILRRSGPLLSLFPDAATTTSDAAGAAAAKHGRARHVVLTPKEQRAYLVARGRDCFGRDDAGDTVAERYDLFAKSPTLSNLATELWKYCAMYAEGGICVDAETAPLVALGDALGWDRAGGSGGGNKRRKNYVVVAATYDAGVSPSLLPPAFNPDGSKASISDAVTVADSLGTGNPVAISSLVAVGTRGQRVPRKMVQMLMETELGRLEEDALLLPKRLMELIREDEERAKEDDAGGGGGSEWGLLQQRCNGIEVAAGGGEGSRTLRHCPMSVGYCCDILDPNSEFVFLLSRQSLVPNQILPDSSTLRQPLNGKGGEDLNSDAIGEGDEDSDADAPTSSVAIAARVELPFLSTVRDETSPEQLESFAPGSSSSTPNIHELLSRISALPNQESNKRACMECLRDKVAADCVICREKCPNFCDRLCELTAEEKPVKRMLRVEGPRYRKDPERLIPRIVHQTWFETVNPEKYPNMSRLIESWKRSGWTYHFWDDASAADFLSLHFPPEVRDAYDAILPGAFKADLFRYCVLLIQGGVYADLDVMLESRLDASVPPDVGFMVPVDAPGIKPNNRMCLWNGFIASAPAHPYLARAIEHVVNNIRNRFTVVDYDATMCPEPELSVVHAWSTLFTAGPCVLGQTVNEVMGRGLQQTFVEGDLELPQGVEVEVAVPGRTIILQQNKWDMGAHRFTWVENNLVVAATDMPDYDDRKDLEGEDEEQATHYSKTLDKINLYGEAKVYTDRNIAHERIVMKTQ